MKTIISAVYFSVVMATSTVATAQTETHHGMATHTQGSLEQMANRKPLHERCGFSEWKLPFTER
jgi:hypothetical protein